MTNYKGSTQRTITVAGVVIIVPSNATIKHLIDIVAASSAADGLMDISDGLIYQVTSGKTFRILGISLTSAGTVAQTVVVSTGDTENAETATLFTLQIPYVAGLPMWFSVDKELASAKFLTYNPSSTGTNMIEVIGYEY